MPRNRAAPGAPPGATATAMCVKLADAGCSKICIQRPAWINKAREMQ